MYVLVCHALFVCVCLYVSVCVGMHFCDLYVGVVVSSTIGVCVYVCVCVSHQSLNSITPWQQVHVARATLGCQVVRIFMRVCAHCMCTCTLHEYVHTACVRVCVRAHCMSYVRM